MASDAEGENSSGGDDKNSYMTKMSVVEAQLNIALLFINVSVVYSMFSLPGEKVGPIVYAALVFICLSFLLQLVIGAFIGVIVYKSRKTATDRHLFQVLNVVLVVLTSILVLVTVIVMILLLAAGLTTPQPSKILGEPDDNVPFCY